MGRRVDALANRAQEDSFFLASALRDYAESEGIDDLALAQRMGCSPRELSAIRLCRRPSSDVPQFSDDVDRIASRFHLDAELLAAAVRLSHALVAMRRPASGERGSLMAARDRPQPLLHSSDVEGTSE